MHLSRTGTVFSASSEDVTRRGGMVSLFCRALVFEAFRGPVAEQIDFEEIEVDIELRPSRRRSLVDTFVAPALSKASAFLPLRLRLRNASMADVGVNGNVSGMVSLVDEATDFLVGAATSVVEGGSRSVAIFIPTAFESRFEPSEIRAGADAGRWHIVGCVGT